MFPIRDNIPSRTTPIVNYSIIFICVIVFLMQLVSERVSTDGHHDLVERYGLIPLRVLHPHAQIVVSEVHPFETPFGVELQKVRHRLPRLPFSPWWTLLTCIFLHGGWLHIIGNMWFLYIFGDNVEDRIGHFRYILFYLGCGLAGSVIHLLTNLDSTLPTIGASGAIAGVMGAYFVFYPRARVLTLVPIVIFLTLIDLPAPVFLGVWFFIQFLQGLAPVTAADTGGVAWWAHIGGFAAGVIVAFAMIRSHTARPAVESRIDLRRGTWPARQW